MKTFNKAALAAIFFLSLLSPSLADRGSERQLDAWRKSGQMQVDDSEQTTKAIVPLPADQMVDALGSTVGEMGGVFETATKVGSGTNLRTSWFDARGRVWALEVQLAIQVQANGSNSSRVILSGLARGKADGEQVGWAKKEVRSVIHGVLVKSYLTARPNGF